VQQLEPDGRYENANLNLALLVEEGVDGGVALEPMHLLDVATVHRNTLRWKEAIQPMR
jgi:hypothetical protein